MSFFNKKKDKIVDWRTRSASPIQRSQRAIPSTSNLNANNSKANSSLNDGYATLGFLGNIANSEDNSNVYSSQQYESFEDTSLNPEEKRSKLAKRLLEMTNKMEDLSNQIYHLTQRLELVEKRLKINFE